MKKIPTRKKKARLSYCPRFTGAFEGHAFNQIKKVYPRLAASWEWDDLLHEAIIVFLICREKAMERGVDNPAWFMNLFSRALYWRFVDLQRGQFSYISLDELAERDEPATEVDAGFCWRVLQELPEDMRGMLGALGEGSDSDLTALWSRFRDLAVSGNEILMTKEI